MKKVNCNPNRNILGKYFWVSWCQYCGYVECLLYSGGVHYQKVNNISSAKINMTKF